MPITVKIQITFETRARDQVVELGREAIEVLRKQPGFLGMEQFLSKDDKEIMALLQWEKEEDFYACKRSPYWLAVMPTWSELQEDYEVDLTSRIYGLVE